MLDPNRLRVFRSVLASGGVQAAADNLGMTSSAVSQHISALAAQTGLVLFDRQGRGIVPTQAARILEAQTDALMAEYEAIDDLLADLREGKSGRVTIGHFSSAGVTWLPLVARQLVKEMPDLVLELVMTEAGFKGTIPDLDLTLDPPDGPAERPGYRRVELRTDPFVAVVPLDHPFAERDEIPLIEFKGETLITNDTLGSTGHRLVVAACAAAGFTARFPVQAEDHVTAIAFVEAGLGVSIMPRLTASIIPPTLVTRRITSPEPRRSLVAMVHETGLPNKAADRALELLLALT